MQRLADGIQALLRDSVRHLLALLLVTATVAGTIWTFSNGHLSLSRNLMELLTTGALVGALEFTILALGFRLGTLDHRIRLARTKADAQSYRLDQRRTLRWLVVALAFSFASNVLYRHWLTSSWLDALMEGAAQVALLWIITVALRALEIDHDERARTVSRRALVDIVTQSGRVVRQGLREMARGRTLEPQQLQQMGLSLSVIAMYAPREEVAVLRDTITRATGGATVDAEAEAYLTSADVSELYAMPLRTAQVKVANMPGRRRGRNGRAWEVPASAVYAQLGVPGRVAGALPAPGRTRRLTQRDAAIAQQDMDNARAYAARAREPADVPQEVA